MNKTSGKYQAYLIYLALTTITLTVFWQVRNFEFVNYDDDVYVSKNEHIYTGITFDNIKWLFTKDVGRWHPLTGLTHMLDCELFGLNSGRHHLTNLLLHIANTLLLFAVLNAMTGSPRRSEAKTGAIWQSAFVAALFAVHPLHVESVAWISGRKDLLSTLFWILAIGAYFHYVETRSLTRYLLALMLFAMGLMAKPMVVTLPFVFLLLDYWPLQRFQLKIPSYLVLEKVPFVALSIVSSAVTFLIQRNIGAIGEFETLPLTARAANAVVSYLKYIMKMICPTDLAVFYPDPGNTLPYWKIFTSAVMLAIVTILVIRFAGKHKYLAVGWFWYLGTLVPVIGLIQVGSHAMADRYTYLSLTGLFIIIAWGAGDLLGQWRYKKIALSFASVVVVCVLSVCAWFQTGYWHDSIKLFSHALEVTTGNYIAYNNRGFTYDSKGQFDLAVSDFNKTLGIVPEYGKAYNNRGNTYGKCGRYELALADFNKAIELDPKDSHAYYNRGTFYSQVKGQYDLAIADLSKTIEIEPRYPKAHNNRGISYYKKGEFDLAISDYNKELEISPASADTYNNRGNAYYRKGKYDLAISDFNKAIELNPKLAEVYFNKAGACEAAGCKKDAIDAYKGFILHAPPQYVPQIERAKQRIQELER